MENKLIRTDSTSLGYISYKKKVGKMNITNIYVIVINYSKFF